MSRQKGRNVVETLEQSADFIGDGSKVVTSAGTRETLSDNVTACWKVLITAKRGNTNRVWVGGATVAVDRGKPLVPLQQIWLEVDDLKKIYIDVDTNGEGVDYLYLV